MVLGVEGAVGVEVTGLAGAGGTRQHQLEGAGGDHFVAVGDAALDLDPAAVVAAEILVLFFFALLGWSGMRVLEILEGENLVSLTWVPVSVTQSIIPIGAVLFIVAELLSLPDYWRDVMAGRSVEHQPLAHGATPEHDRR